MTLYRNLCFTLNNPRDGEQDSILSSDIWRYVVVGREVAPTTLTPHLQRYGVLNKRMRLGALKKILGDRMHIEERRKSHAEARDYCKKDGIFEERGEEPQQGRRTDLETACKSIKEHGSLARVADEQPMTFVKYSRGLRDLALMIIPPYTHDDVRGLWYYGEPGTGKSRLARENNPDAYLKAQNRWFDGYDGQTSIILDDLDEGGKCLGHLLKIWTDRYACTGETKGGTVQLRHKVFIVTSNYSIDDLWADQPKVLPAIKRRFTVTYFPKSLWK